MASSCADPSSKMADEASAEDAASCCSELLSVCTLSSSSSGSGDANGDESNCTPAGSDADDDIFESGVTDAEQPVATDPSSERVQCATASYDQGHGDSDAEPEDADPEVDEDPADGVPYDPEDTDSAPESDEEFQDDEDYADGGLNIPAMPPHRPPGQ
ncbi:uncharacterized protein LOC144152635 [Haemaphysalis longicornis]